MAHLAIVGQEAAVLVDDLIHAAQVAMVDWRAMLARIVLQQVQARHLQGEPRLSGPEHKKLILSLESGNVRAPCMTGGAMLSHHTSCQGCDENTCDTCSCTVLI